VHISPPVAEIPGCTIAAARAGKHIVLGKPMAMTPVEADDMVAAVETDDVGLMRCGRPRRVVAVAGALIPPSPGLA